MTDFIGTTAFGLKLNSLRNPEAEFRNENKIMLKSSYRRFFELLSIIFFPTLRPVMNAKFFDDRGTDFLRKSFWAVINERIRTNIKRPDLIDLLIDIKNYQEKDDSDSYSKYKITNFLCNFFIHSITCLQITLLELEGDALVSQAAVFFAAGNETSTLMSSLSLYELAKNQDIQNRLRDEILEGLEKNNGKITYEMVKYLQLCIHKILVDSLNYGKFLILLSFMLQIKNFQSFR